MIYAVGGVSGSGKTCLRRQQNELRRLVCVDIETIYRRAEQQGYRLGWNQALEQFLTAVQQCLEHYADIVVEAFFRPGGEQRVRLEQLAARYGQQVTYIWCSAPRNECRRRVEADVDDNWQRKNMRLHFIDTVAAQHFLPVRGESPDEVFGHPELRRLAQQPRIYLPAVRTLQNDDHEPDYRVGYLHETNQSPQQQVCFSGVAVPHFSRMHYPR